jgi:DNA repair protein RadC
MSSSIAVNEMPVPIEGPPALPRTLLVARRRALEQRWAEGGVAALADDEAFALLCGVDAGVAGNLLAVFGSTPEVWGAAEADLARVAGPGVAVRIKLAQEVARRVLVRPLKQRTVLGAWGQVTDHLRTAMVGAPREQFRVLFLDRRHRLIADEVMNEGTIWHAPVYPREVMRRALELHASGLVVAHNHPSGDPTPSQADVDMTRQLADAARALAISLHDHVLIAGDRAVSFKALGLM